MLLSGYVQANRNVELERESQAFSSGNKVAVVVGVNRYSQLSGLKNLKYARSDAQVINSVLSKRHGYETTPLLGSEANKNHILAAIQNAGTRLRGKNGTLIFFFAGHGFSKGNSNYLATADFAMSRVAQSALSVHELEQAIRSTGARRAIIFIDACREDPWIDGARNFAQDSFRVQQSKGIQHLFASEFGRQSWETDKLRHGVFSYFLYRGLNGGAVENHGLISFESLTGYVQEEVGKWSHQNLPVTQYPFSEGKAYGVFILGQMGGANRPVKPTSQQLSTRQPTVVDTRPTIQPSTPTIDDFSSNFNSRTVHPVTPQLRLKYGKRVSKNQLFYRVTVNTLSGKDKRPESIRIQQRWKKKGINLEVARAHAVGNNNDVTFMVYSKQFKKPEDALSFYREMRKKANPNDDLSNFSINVECSHLKFGDNSC